VESAIPQTGEAVSLYCFTLPGRPAPAGPGVDERWPHQIQNYGGIAAIVGVVEVRDFIGDLGESHLGDIAWLGPRACRHAAVVEQAMAAGPVFPLPFGTLFSGWGALDQAIGERATEIADTLNWVAESQEWSVEGTLERQQAVDFLLQEGLQSGRFSLPEAIGRRHLEEQKLRRTLAAELNDWLEHRLMAIQQELAALCRDCRPRRLLEGRILHRAYLVPVHQTEAFRRTVRAMTDHHEPSGLHLRLTGPWPPYTFCQSTP
jgi:hypothetical protein